MATVLDWDPFVIFILVYFFIAWIILKVNMNYKWLSFIFSFFLPFWTLVHWSEIASVYSGDNLEWVYGFFITFSFVMMIYGFIKGWKTVGE